MNRPKHLKLALPQSRRTLLKRLAQGSLLSSPLGIALSDLLGGTEAIARPGDHYRYIEINLRDQWDFGQVFVPPGLRGPEVARGPNLGKACLFYKGLTATKNGFYLTEDGLPLLPHCDHIAALEVCPPSRGLIHGHDGANDMRSPGYSYNLTSDGPKRLAMWSEDIPAGNVFATGNENMYSAVPTPLYVHASHLKDLNVVSTPWVFKGNSRGMEVYHFRYDIQNVSLARIYSRKQLDQVLRPAPLAFLSAEEKLHLRHLLKYLGQDYFKYWQSQDGSFAKNYESVADSLLAAGDKPLHFDLSEEEKAFWSSGVPRQNQPHSPIPPNLVGVTKGEIWEQVAWAYKALLSGVSSSIGLEFDYIDNHFPARDETYMRILAQQTALPLARLIEKLKADQLFDKTLIAIFTADGSRSPDAGSDGQADGKNAVILAGGMIKGGYYGDIRLDPQGIGQSYSYHIPDPSTGALSEKGMPWEKRLPGAHIWRTIMAALAIPDARIQPYGPDIAAKPLSFLLRR